MPTLRRKTSSLLVRAQRDVEAFAAFYDAYVDDILAFIGRRVLDAELTFDLTAETFGTALESRHQFRGRSRAQEQAWLYAIARSQLTRYWRRGRLEREALHRLGVDVPALSDGSIERVEELAELSSLAPALEQAMGELPPDQARAVRLRVVDELGYDELAERLGVSAQVARARVSRGLRALARALQDELGDVAA